MTIKDLPSDIQAVLRAGCNMMSEDHDVIYDKIERYFINGYLIGTADICIKLGRSRRTLYNYMHNTDLGTVVKWSKKMNCFVCDEKELDNWIKNSLKTWQSGEDTRQRCVSED